MDNFVQAGSNLTLPAPAIVKAGDLVIIGALIGVASGSAASGENFDLVTAGVFELPKATGAITLGAGVYWDAVAKKVTTTSSGNTLCGYAVKAAGSPDATAKIKLKAV